MTSTHHLQCVLIKPSYPLTRGARLQFLQYVHQVLQYISAKKERKKENTHTYSNILNSITINGCCLLVFYETFVSHFLRLLYVINLFYPTHGDETSTVYSRKRIAEPDLERSSHFAYQSVRKTTWRKQGETQRNSLLPPFLFLASTPRSVI